MKKSTGIVLSLSFLSAALVAFVSLQGLLVPDFYMLESGNWRVQSMGQDAVDLLLITPLLVIASLLSIRGSRFSLSLWAGLNIYLTYTFSIYCFDIHFNSLFLCYCAVLGLSFYSSVFYIAAARSGLPAGMFKARAVKLSAVYFAVIACIFSLLWLADIASALAQHKPPAELLASGLATNPVHVLDLAIILPAMLTTSVMIFSRQAIGPHIAPALLMFCLCMHLTVAYLSFTAPGGQPGTFVIATVMLLFAIVCIVLLAAWPKEQRQP